MKLLRIYYEVATAFRQMWHDVSDAVSTKFGVVATQFRPTLNEKSRKCKDILTEFRRSFDEVATQIGGKYKFDEDAT